MSPGCGSTAGWICEAGPFATKVEESARAPKMRLSPVHLGGARPERDPDIDDRNPAGPCRGRRPTQGLEQGWRRVSKPLHDRVLDVHDEQRGVGHGRSLLPVTRLFLRMPDAANDIESGSSVID